MLPERRVVSQAIELETCACLTDDRERTSRWRKLGRVGEHNIDGSTRFMAPCSVRNQLKNQLALSLYMRAWLAEGSSSSAQIYTKRGLAMGVMSISILAITSLLSMVLFHPSLAQAENKAAKSAPTINISGEWVDEDGIATARLAPCAMNEEFLCGTVIHEVLEPDEESDMGKVIIKDIRPTKPGQFSARYQIDDRNYWPVTLKALAPNGLELKICFSLVCESVRLSRV